MKAGFFLLFLMLPFTGTVQAQSVRPVAIIRVLDRQTLQPIQATIMIVSQHTDRQLTPLYEDKMYKFKITPGDSSTLTIYADGYETLNEPVCASRMSSVETFYLRPLANGKLPLSTTPILHEDITTVLYFSQSEAKVLEKSRPHLERIAEFLQNNDKHAIELAGHTDNVGDSYKNLLLSNARTDVIKDILVDHQIAAGRIRSKAFGDKKPVAPNDTESNRSLNRRVEMRVR
ncbi:OmpA family protein [Dyadobacter sandarakinus]|uniref:OmpA family protein n=1 Tax=Dyadobacter sandarakinus TaxID=2747268 RepID=A0ABX7I1L8_9BACT|nr:OmpA family protein [Dyadobacter sandarakinus]QRQ99664.1 OmpA family protein [Dyadobacter sandarakinus]